VIGQRLEEYRKTKGYKVQELAAMIGLSQGSLSDIKNGKTQPHADTIEKIVRNTDINAHWLATGEGTMLRAKLAVGQDVKIMVAEGADVYATDRCAGDATCKKLCKTYLGTGNQEVKDMLSMVVDVLSSGNKDIITSLRFNLITLRQAAEDAEKVRKLLNPEPNPTRKKAP